MRLEPAIDQWVQAQREQKLAEGTTRERLYAARKLLAAKGNVHVKSLTDAQVADFLKVNAGTWSKGTYRTTELGLAEFFEWLYLNRLIERRLLRFAGIALKRPMPAPKKRRRNRFEDIIYDEHARQYDRHQARGRRS